MDSARSGGMSLGDLPQFLGLEQNCWAKMWSKFWKLTVRVEGVTLETVRTASTFAGMGALSLLSRKFLARSSGTLSLIPAAYSIAFKKPSIRWMLAISVERFAAS